MTTVIRQSKVIRVTLFYVYLEDHLGELASISFRKETRVDVGEIVFAQFSRRTILNVSITCDKRKPEVCAQMNAHNCDNNRHKMSLSLTWDRQENCDFIFKQVVSYLDEALVPSQDLGFREFSVVFEFLDLSLGKLCLAFHCSHFSYFRISSIKKNVRDSALVFLVLEENLVCCFPA